MGKADIVQSDYFENNNRFSDAFNGVLFGGKQIIFPEELEEADSGITTLFYNGNGQKVICDKVKKWQGLHLAIFSLENQSYIDYRMVLRVMKSEAMGYDKQWRQKTYRNKKIWKNKKKKITRHEFLSGICKNEKFVPIITLVLYFGTEDKWDGAVCLYDLLEIDEKLKPFVTNYKLNLFDYHTCNDFSVFHTENRVLFEALANSRSYDNFLKVMEQNLELYNNLDYESAKAIIRITGMNIDLEKIRNEESGGFNMCRAVEECIEKGRQIGIQEGIEKGKADGIAEGKEKGIAEGKEKGIKESNLSAIRNIMKNLHMTAERAMDILEIDKGKRKEYSRLL